MVEVGDNRCVLGARYEISPRAQEPSAPDWIGMVCQKTSPAAIAEAAIEDAKFVCTRQYGDAPDVTLHGRLDLTFSCESCGMALSLQRLCRASWLASPSSAVCALLPSLPRLSIPPPRLLPCCGGG